MSDTGRVQSPERAAWNKVHMAVLRDELWSPACTDERGWVAPLADPNLAGQITCKVCHPIAMRQNGSQDV
jgi:hypothetical protein